MTSRIALALALTTIALGCPREVQTPEPGEATPCEMLADCNGGRTCAEYPLRACVDALCEDQPSLVIPCSDAGP